jgi:hypothetical protein
MKAGKRTKTQENARKSNVCGGQTLKKAKESQRKPKSEG